MTMTKKISRGVKISGGLVVVGLIAGSFLGNFMPGLGDGGGAGLPVQREEAVDPAQGENPPPPEKSPIPKLAGDVLQISIVGRSYRILGANGERVNADETTLEQIVQLAVTMTGDEDGIRVRVTREASARAKTEDDLLSKLLEAGLTPESIIGLEETAAETH